MSSVIVPPATLGVLGGGQLGLYFAIAARQAGYRVVVLTPETHAPASHVADVTLVGSFQDTDLVEAFIRQVDVASVETEHVPMSTLRQVQAARPLYPQAEVVHLCQNRLREKSWLRGIGVPVPAFVAVTSPQECETAGRAMTFPAILKTADAGYDGKGQCRVPSADALAQQWRQLGEVDCILEACIDFAMEISVIVARNAHDAMAVYEPFENQHVDHILDLTRCPARIPASLRQQATDMARTIIHALDMVGVLCVEMFVLGDGTLMVNELAPRPHNSGHLTMDAHASSQFDQQWRCICGLAPGDTRQWSPAAMINLLGDCWQHGQPSWQASLNAPQVRTWLYGKTEARPRRKMGHLTATAADVEQAANVLLEARQQLRGDDATGRAAR